MASPFKFFRKYSGGMMIVMVILSMMLFTMDGLFSDPGKNLWLLGMLLGGTVFAIAGISQGRWLQWGIGGAVLGVVLGLVLPAFVQGDGMLDTSLGVVTERDMQDMQIRRQVANRFVVGAVESSFGEGTGRFATLFGFNHPANEDVLLGKLLRAEADDLGIAVDTAMVGDYLKKLTSDKLTQEDYVKVRDAISYNGRDLTNDSLQEILADEIKARMAYQILTTRTATLPPGPEVYWQYFRRLNVRQQIVTAALDVDDFVDDVPDPSSGEIETLFTECKKRFPSQVEPGSPGFRLPFRANVAYLELNTKSVEADLADITDAEIEAYYNEKKETPLIRTPILPDFPKMDDDEEVEDEKSDVKEDAKSDEVPAGDKKAEPKKESNEADAPEKKDATKKNDAKADAPKEKSVEKETPAAESNPSENPVKEAAKEEKAAETKAEEQASDAGDTEEEVDSTQIEVLEIEPATEEEKSDTAATEEASKAADSSAAETEKAQPAEEEKKPATTTEAEGKPATLTIPDAPADPSAPPKIEYEYRKLDDELKQEIREELKRQRVADIVKDKMAKAKTTMETLTSDRASHRFALMEAEPAKYNFDSRKQQEAFKELRESMQDYDGELDGKLEAFAAENGFSYVETPLLSDLELYSSEEYLIGKATEPVDNPMMAAQTPSVASLLYQSFSTDEQNNDAQIYFVRQAERASASQDGSMSHYAYWATDFSLSHVPELDEPGVKDAVVLALKRRAAREIIEKRGKELAQAIRDAAAKEGDDRQDMVAVLSEKTVTGKEDAATLAVRRSEPFTWLRTSSAAPQSFQQPQASLSPITFSDSIGGSLENVGDDFMKILFEDMADEEVAVVPDFDFSKYYVVQVTNRFPTPEIGEESLRERFATEGKRFSFRDSPILGVMQQQLNGPASVEWEKGLWRKYGVDPDGDPETDE